MSIVRQRIRKLIPRRLRPYFGAIRRKVAYNPIRIYLQKQKLLKSPLLDAGQIELLNNVNNKIHYKDGMYSGNGEDYFLVGLSAVGCVNDVLGETHSFPIRNVLDLPSGYGRELRFLALRFPEATFTACDIQPEAADFCAETFGAVAAYSQADLNEVSFDGNFDLIWCGSLITHLDSASTMDLLNLFSRHLNPGGILIFTTHGDYAFERMRSGNAAYDLQKESVSELVASYGRIGYGYQDYERGGGYFDFHPKKRGYGISLMSPDWIRGQSEKISGLQEVYFKERGWGNHQDVFAFTKSGKAKLSEGNAA